MKKALIWIVTSAIVLTACASAPVTGRKQLMLISEDTAIVESEPAYFEMLSEPAAVPSAVEENVVTMFATPGIELPVLGAASEGVESFADQVAADDAADASRAAAKSAADPAAPAPEAEAAAPDRAPEVPETEDGGEAGGEEGDAHAEPEPTTGTDENAEAAGQEQAPDSQYVPHGVDLTEPASGKSPTRIPPADVGPADGPEAESPTLPGVEAFQRGSKPYTKLPMVPRSFMATTSSSTCCGLIGELPLHDQVIPS